MLSNVIFRSRFSNRFSINAHLACRPFSKFLKLRTNSFMLPVIVSFGWRYSVALLPMSTHWHFDFVMDSLEKSLLYCNTFHSIDTPSDMGGPYPIWHWVLLPQYATQFLLPLTLLKNPLSILLENLEWLPLWRLHSTIHLDCCRGKSPIWNDHLLPNSPNSFDVNDSHCWEIWLSREFVSFFRHRVNPFLIHSQILFKICN